MIHQIHLHNCSISQFLNCDKEKERKNTFFFVFVFWVSISLKVQSLVFGDYWKSEESVCGDILYFVNPIWYGCLVEEQSWKRWGFLEFNTEGFYWYNFLFPVALHVYIWVFKSKGSNFTHGFLQKLLNFEELGFSLWVDSGIPQFLICSSE